MARYGFEYGPRHPGWGGWGRSPRADFGYGQAPYGGYDAEYGGGPWGRGGWGGPGGRDTGGRYDTGYWSATEYGVYLGPDYPPAGHGAGYRGMGDVAGYETGGWAGYAGMDDGWGGEGEGEAEEVRVGDIMTENPETVTPDTPLHEVARLMRDLNVGIIPVVDDPEGGRLRGVITDRDITVRAAAEGKDMKKTKAAEAMTERVETVTENHHVQDVFDVMKREQVRRVPVIDREGRLVGIIAQADLAIDYAGLDVRREAEVEEVIERISEPGRTRWRGPRRGPNAGRGYAAGGPQGYDHDLGDRIRHGWRALRREARGFFGRGYDEGWR